VNLSRKISALFLDVHTAHVTHNFLVSFCWLIFDGSYSQSHFFWLSNCECDLIGLVAKNITRVCTDLILAVLFQRLIISLSLRAGMTQKLERKTSGEAGMARSSDPMRKVATCRTGDERRHGQLAAACQRFTKLRFQLCLFLFFSMLFTTFNNLNLSLTILCIVKPVNKSVADVRSQTIVCRCLPFSSTLVA